MRIKLIFYLLTLPFILKAQSESIGITLEECQQRARDNYPLIKQFELIESSKKYDVENLSKKYLPQIVLNTQASLQSEVIALPIHIQGVEFPEKSKDQYKIALDITQSIWDGGTTKSEKLISIANSNIKKQKIEVELFQIKDRVNQLYFGILSINKQLGILDIYNETLKTNREFVEALCKNGVALSSDIDIITVELINNEQKKIELQSLKAIYQKILSGFINQKLTEQTIYNIPETNVDLSSSLIRPEISLFNEERLLLDAQTSSINAKNMPNLSLFAQGGYGRPGLNIMSNDFDFWAIGGIRVSWNFGNLYTRKREKRIIRINKSIIDTDEETFRFNNNNQQIKYVEEITKNKLLIDKDDEIIKLRNKVRLASENRYKNGVYNINDLVRDINIENQAIQTKAIHEIDYILSIYNYKNVKGE